MSVRVAATIKTNFTSWPLLSVLLFQGREGKDGVLAPPPQATSWPSWRACLLPRAQASSEGARPVKPARHWLCRPLALTSQHPGRQVPARPQHRVGVAAGGWAYSMTPLSKPPRGVLPPPPETTVPCGWDCPCPGWGGYLAPSPLCLISPAAAELETKSTHPSRHTHHLPSSLCLAFPLAPRSSVLRSLTPTPSELASSSHRAYLVGTW